MKEPPTIICNKFTIITGGPLVRFAFGEQVIVGGDIEFHSAIMMSMQDAMELANSIVKTINEHAQKEKELSAGNTNDKPVTIN